ncbi:20066_t:CDS:2, partial [Gigaspora rosea]
DHPTITLSNREKSHNFKSLVSGKIGTRQCKLESGNTLQETLALYWKNKWDEFNKLDFDDPFVSGILYLPFLPWLNELLSTEDIIELKNNSSFIHNLANSWWLPYLQKIQSKNKDLVFKNQGPFSIFCQRMYLVETGMYNEPDHLLNEVTWRHDAYDFFKYLLNPLISQNKQYDHVMKLKHYWAEVTLDSSSERKTKAQNKTIRGRMVDFVLRLKSAEDKSLELFVCEIAGGPYNLKSDKILSDKRKVFRELQDMLAKIIGYFITNYKDRFTDNIVNKLHQIKVYAAIGFDMKKGINICYPLSTITIPKTYSEASYLKILIENFWCLRNALQEMIELVIEINEDLEQLHDSRPSKNVEGFLQYWNIYVPKT